MKRIWTHLLALAMTGFCSCYADALSFENVPLDTQVNAKLTPKRDPLDKIEEPKKVVKPISYAGLWHIKPGKTTCPREIDDFKVMIKDNKIDTVVGMTVEGRMLEKGAFQMTAQSKYWSIEFKGVLKEAGGQANWIRKNKPDGQCTGSVQIVRLKS